MLAVWRTQTQTEVCTEGALRTCRAWGRWRFRRAALKDGEQFQADSMLLF